MSTKKNYARVADSDPDMISSAAAASAGAASTELKKRGMYGRSYPDNMIVFFHWFKKSAWALWIHFGVMFLKCSIFLSLFNTTKSLDNFDATTIALCIAFIDYVIHSVFNHQHLIFNLTAGVVLAFRKWIFHPIDCEPGKPCTDAYGNDTTTRCNRFYTFIRDMMNMAALVVGSILAAEFNIRVVFPRKPDEENWKFITHVRDGLSNSDVFGIALVGFFFLAWMLKQMHYRIQTDIPNCADDVTCGIDCAISRDQSSLIAAISFVSAFWLFVAIRAPNNVVVMLGAAIISGDYSHLGTLFAAEILVWTVIEMAYFIYAKHNATKKKKMSPKDSVKSQIHSSAHGEHENPKDKYQYDHFISTYYSNVNPIGVGNGFRNSS